MVFSCKTPSIEGMRRILQVHDYMQFDTNYQTHEITEGCRLTSLETRTALRSLRAQGLIEEVIPGKVGRRNSATWRRVR
jgi:hypothetical protein